MENETNTESGGARTKSAPKSVLEQRLHQQELLADFGVMAIGAKSLQEIFEAAVHCLITGLDVEFGKVLKLTPERDAVRIVAGSGWVEALVGDGFVPIGRDSQAGFTLLSEKPVIVDDLRSEERFDGPALLRNHGVVSGVSCVIGKVDEPWGVLGAHTAERRDFNDHDANFVASVANVIAQSVTTSRAEAYAAEQEQRLELAMKAADMQFVQIDVQKGTFIVEDGEVPVGFEGSEERDLLDEIHPEDRPQVVESFRSHVEGEEELFSATYRAGDSRWFETRGRVVTWADGLPLRFVGIHRDVTKQVRHRERERELELQLQQVQKMEAVGRLAGGVAHDFNNILTAITGYVELLLEDEEKREKVRDLNEIRNAIERARRLTQQLLAFSRREIHQARPVDVDSQLERSTEMLRKVLGEGVELKLDLQADGRLISIDPGQLEQLVVNIADNAAGAMERQGTFMVRTRVEAPESTRDGESGCRIVVEFVDDGCGIDDDIREKIFEPFFTTKKGKDGTGLGLSLVYRVVERTGATIEVESGSEQGTTFRFTWPERGVSDESDEPADDRPDLKARDVRILFVEDDPHLRSMGMRIMRRAGYRVNRHQILPRLGKWQPKTVRSTSW